MIKRHKLDSTHKAYLATLGLPSSEFVDIDEEEHRQDIAAWQHTHSYERDSKATPISEAEIYKKAIGLAVHRKHHARLRAEALSNQVLRHEHYHYVSQLKWILFALLALVLFIFHSKAHAQFSHLAIQVCQTNCTGANALGFHNSYTTLIAGSNVTFTDINGTITVNASSTASTAFSALTSALNTNAGTFSVSGNTWDFSAATLLKARALAGLTTSVNGDFGQDTTTGYWHFWQNGHDRLFIGSTNVGTAGQVAESNADGTSTFADPIVSGPDAPGAAPTKNPVQIGLFDGTNVQRASSDTSGRLNVNINGTPTVEPGNTANTTPWLFSINQGGNSATVTAANALKVDASAVTQPISAASLPLPTGAAQDASVTSLEVAQGSTTSGQKGILTQGVVTTSAPSYTTAQTSPLSLTLAGALRTDASATTQPVSGTVTANAGSGQFNVTCTAANCPVNTAQVGGNAVTTAAAGVQKVGIVGNTGATLDAATGAAPPVNALLTAGLGSGATGGTLLGIPVADTYKSINISTATTTLLVTGVTGRQVRISSLHLIAAAADNAALIEGTGATCGTGTTGMAGGTTAASGYNFAANGGIAFGSGVGVVIQTATTGDSVCIVTSAAVQLSGGISYAVY